MSEQVNIHTAKTQFSRLVERAAAGEEIVIAKAGEPRCRLVPLERVRVRRRGFGAMKGKIRMDADWDSDAVNEEVAQAFLGDGQSGEA